MLVSGEFIDKPDFAQYNKIVVPEDEAYGANCIWVNGTASLPRAIRPCSRPCRIWATRRSSSIPPSIARSTVAFLACHCASNAIAVQVS